MKGTTSLISFFSLSRYRILHSQYQYRFFNSSSSSSPSLSSSSPPSSNKLFVGGLSWSVDEKSLKDAFSSFGDVTEVRIVYDKDSGRARGFGFVIFSNEDDAKYAKDAMDGKALLGRPLKINFALEKARGGPVVVPRTTSFISLFSLSRHRILHSQYRFFNSSSSSPSLSLSSPSSNKLFVGGLSWSVDEKSLKDAFSSFGDVTKVRIVYDKDSGRARGFGFVILSNEDDAKSAKDAMDPKALLGRPLRINFALEKARGGPAVVPWFSDNGRFNRH
ncbi:RNA-binding (RRM/RBD/RNP motifs) family protein [Trifolium repens]|nr:RNA-binding (RRM/RBD/RNP motifs) family protein [Trifolium repens]